MWTPEFYQETIKFAGVAHGDQKVPGIEIPYLAHLSNVCMEVLHAWCQTKNFEIDFAVQVALLHDTLEDTQVSFAEIETRFGARIAQAVESLTKNETLPKEIQMNDCLKRIINQPQEAAIVKMADRITNLQRPPIHWTAEKIRYYIEESKQIYKHLHHAHVVIANRLLLKINDYGQYLKGEQEGF